jgi:NDP-sugar pyrophosphorylase family protein
MLTIAILAGGRATRLQPLTETLPKSLIPVAGEPFLAHQLRLLRTAGIERVILCVGHLADQIQDFAGDGSVFGLNIEYAFDGEPCLGTGGAIRNALPLLGGHFFTLYGDSYVKCDFRAVERAFFDARKDALMTVIRNEGRWDTSNVEYAGGEIIAYDKRVRTPAMQYIDYGVGVFRASVFSGLPKQLPFDLSTLYAELLAQRRLGAYEVEQRFYEIGSLSGIRDLEAYLSSDRSPCQSTS